MSPKPRYNFDEACIVLLGLALNASAEEAVKVLIHSGIDASMMFSLQQTRIFNAMMSCLRGGQLPNEHFVMVVDSSISKEYIAGLRKVWTQANLEETLDIICPIIKQCWQERRYWEAVEKAKALPYEQSLQSLLNVISSDTTTQFEEHFPSSVFEETKGAGTPIQIGIPWIDTHVPAYTSRFWAMLGGFKQRKTTFLRNLVLHSLLYTKNKPVIVYLAAENTRDITSADFLAMVYTAYLYEKGTLNLDIVYKYEEDGIVKSLNTKASHFSNAENMLNLLKRLRNGKAEVPDGVIKSIENARLIFSNIFDKNLKIFDFTATGGKANTLAGCQESVAKVHMLDRAAGQNMIISLDYLQLVSTPDKEKLQQMNKVVQWGLDSCGDYDALTIFLAQLNSTSDRKDTARKDVHVDYAPDLPRSVMAAFATKYDPQNPTSLDVELVAARRQSSGIRVEFAIDPVSGMILRKDL